MLDEFFMRRALELAALGRTSTAPNPMVGCVITYGGRIIGEGWHQQYGGPHAEVNAIRSVADPALLPDATVYVTLEPCSHYGKTPPCADLLVQHQVRRVVVANQDPNPLVQGRGLSRLREAGIAVEVGLLAQEGAHLNRRFFTFLEKHRPYIVLKWAQTADGYLARSNYDSKWISSSLSRRLVHRWRAEEAAILVGSRTAEHDNPRLNVRDWKGPDPVRVVIDRELRLSPSLYLFDGTQPTLCYNTQKSETRPTATFVKLASEGTPLLVQLVEDLHQRRLMSLFVEGGSALLSHFLEAGLWDEARVFVSPQRFGEGIAAPVLRHVPYQKQHLKEDELRIYYPTF
ncbi:diaminohydroxyphosphoribosylaminopyrimidine deaminase / 5-amino-6-(5-phosphoribosylamino)uracil reductase [Catalinimonas alkaloidigena]|uniref:Riboflavin biosynthesis protein RibD n=1 Tax=Catalinimonas alkaloidigena TaxID=1075417 RepID=A0A1G9Q2I5_9BACT|nr:bifunctional diaminohydroxyphosphoribosylaminopyrimidine deaminase/5-amino-6-(5-phosphoribosylamino)uracil reductase RibD [Catalinimonas alkaloidigena]SDM05262.1 diaminohydroxyphosphoribosylaminopyrimidine deaminase / 5-amino-6-(5-phosphoribosylamino)uracil reductase [Catalinimonas alkaloidigena]